MEENYKKREPKLKRRSSGPDGLTEGSRTPKRVSFANTTTVRTIEKLPEHVFNLSVSDQENNSELNISCNDADAIQDDVFMPMESSDHANEADNNDKENITFEEDQESPMLQIQQWNEKASDGLTELQQDYTIYFNNLDNSDDDAMEMTANMIQPPIMFTNKENYGFNISQPRLDRIPSFSEEQAADGEDNSIFFNLPPSFTYPVNVDQVAEDKTCIFTLNSKDGMELTCSEIQFGGIESVNLPVSTGGQSESVQKMTEEPSQYRYGPADVTALKALTPIEEMSIASSSSLSQGDQESFGKPQKLNFSQLRSRLIETVSADAHVHDKENWPVLPPGMRITAPSIPASTKTMENESIEKNNVYNTSVEVSMCQPNMKSTKEDNMNLSPLSAPNKFVENYGNEKTQVFNTTMDVTECYQTYFHGKNERSDSANPYKGFVSRIDREDNIMSEKTKIFDVSMDVTGCYPTGFQGKSDRKDNTDPSIAIISKKFREDSITSEKTKVFNMSMDVTRCYQTSFQGDSDRKDNADHSIVIISKKSREDSITSEKTKIFNMSMDVTECYEKKSDGNGNTNNTNPSSDVISKRFGQNDTATVKNKMSDTSMDITGFHSSLLEKHDGDNNLNFSVDTLTKGLRDNDQREKTVVCDMPMDVTSCYQKSEQERIDEHDSNYCSSNTSSQGPRENDNVNEKTKICNESINVTSCSLPTMQEVNLRDCGMNLSYNAVQNKFGENKGGEGANRLGNEMNSSFNTVDNKFGESHGNEKTKHFNMSLDVTSCGQNLNHSDSENREIQRKFVAAENVEEMQTVTENVDGFVSEKTVHCTDRENGGMEVVSFTSYNSPNLMHGRPMRKRWHGVNSSQDMSVNENVSRESKIDSNSSPRVSLVEHFEQEVGSHHQQIGLNLSSLQTSLHSEQTEANHSSVKEKSFSPHSFKPLRSQDSEADNSLLKENSKALQPSAVLQQSHPALHKSSVVEHHSSMIQHQSSMVQHQTFESSEAQQQNYMVKFQSSFVQHEPVMIHLQSSMVHHQNLETSVAKQDSHGSSDSQNSESPHRTVASSDESPPLPESISEIQPFPDDLNVSDSPSFSGLMKNVDPDDVFEDSHLLRDQEMPDLFENNSVMPAIESFDDDREANAISYFEQSCVSEAKENHPGESLTTKNVTRDINISYIYEMLELDNIKPLMQQESPLGTQVNDINSFEGHLEKRLLLKPQLTCLQTYVEKLEREIARMKKAYSSLLECLSKDPSSDLLNTASILRGEGDISEIRSKAQKMSSNCEASAKAQINKLRADYLLDLTSFQQTEHSSYKKKLCAMVSDNDKALKMQTTIHSWFEQMDIINQNQTALQSLEKNAQETESNVVSLRSQSQKLDDAIAQANKEASECGLQKSAVEDELTLLRERLSWMGWLSEWAFLKNTQTEMVFGFLSNTVILSVSLFNSEDPQRPIIDISVNSKISSDNKPWVLVAHKVMLRGINKEALKHKYRKFSQLSQLLHELSERASVSRDLCKELRKIDLLQPVTFDDCSMKITITNRRRMCQVNMESDLASGAYPYQPLQWNIQRVLGPISCDKVHAGLNHLKAGDRYLVQAVEIVSSILEKS